MLQMLFLMEQMGSYLGQRLSEGCILLKPSQLFAGLNVAFSLVSCLWRVSCWQAHFSFPRTADRTTWVLVLPTLPDQHLNVLNNLQLVNILKRKNLQIYPALQRCERGGSWRYCPVLMWFPAVNWCWRGLLSYQLGSDDWIHFWYQCKHFRHHYQCFNLGNQWSKEVASIVERHPALLWFATQLVVWQGPTK